MSGKLKSVDGGKVSVLSRGELDRLMRTCQPRSPIPVNDDHEQHQRDREELRARSDARKAKWPNTIEALRKKKEKDRQVMSLHLF
jgi:Zn-finger nucleic acid-binding protein